LGLVPHAGEIGTECCASHLVQRTGECAHSRSGDDWLKRSEHALSVGLAQWDETQTGGDEVCGNRLQERGKRGINRNAGSCSRDSNDNRIGEGTCPNCAQAIERGTWPGGAGRIEKGAALGGTLEVTFL
jgi:hypothetical protein